MTLPDCLMCDDTGFKDHAGLRLDPCNHVQLPPLPDLLPCPNPNCDRSDPRYRASAKGGQYVACGGCGLMVTDGGQDRLYATWNGLLRAPLPQPQSEEADNG